MYPTIGKAPISAASQAAEVVDATESSTRRRAFKPASHLLRNKADELMPNVASRTLNRGATRLLDTCILQTYAGTQVLTLRLLAMCILEDCR